MPRKNNRYLAPIVVAGILIASCVGCGGGSSSPPPPPPNPTPAISTISPTSATAGGSAFTLTVNGSNFVSGSVVSWNGSKLTTTFVSSTQLTASVPATDIATAGTAPIQVTNPTPGGGASNTASFTISNLVPRLNSLSPTNVIVGGDAFTLTLNGSNFVSTSTILWNGSSRPTAFVSSSQVTAQITATDIAAGGKATISVSNPNPGGGASNLLTFSILFLPRFAYVANQGSSTVSILTVDATTGRLQHNGYVLAGSGPISVAVDPSGRFAYVANGASNNMSIFSTNATTGALTSVGTVAAGTFPFSAVVDPSGKFVYAANESSNNISMYAISAATGLLTSTGTIAAGTNPESIAVDPSGRFVYVANQASNNVSMYAINGTTGVLTPIGTGTVGAGSGANAVAVDPYGRFAYVANAGSNDVSMFTIDATSGLLTATGTIAGTNVPTTFRRTPSMRPRGS